ncbi:copper resistance CopC family protein [Actinomycetes bacterium KLBMP 9797]
MIRKRLLPTAALIGVFAVLVPAAPAQAHTELSRTSPAAKSTATKPVSAVTLTFSGLIKKPGTTVVVTGPDQISYSDADAQVLDKTITQKVKPLPVGAITVAWRTAAADGHPLQGSFTFTNNIAPPAPTTAAPVLSAPAPTPPATTAAAPAPAASASDDDGSSSAVWWLVAAAAALLLVLVGGLLWRRRRPAAS